MVSHVHPDMAPILDARRFVTAAKTPEEKRRNWTAYTQTMNVPVPSTIKVYDRVIPVPGYDVPVRVYHPVDSSGVLPCVIYLHGGGFMMGDLDSSDTIAWGLCAEVGAVVVSVDYRLTPEFPFPAAFEDCYGVAEWLSKHGAEIGVDPSRIAICGDSAGGNLSAAVCLAACDRNGPSLRAQALVYPAMGGDMTSGSFVSNANSPSLTTAASIDYLDLYTTGALHSGNPYALPAKASNLGKLPPALVHTGELDPIRDDGRLYASLLASSGNWVTYREAAGFLHGFLRVRLTGPQAKKEFAAVTGFLREHLA